MAVDGRLVRRDRGDGSHPRILAQQRPRAPLGAVAPTLTDAATQREAVINAHDCGFPDEACSTCEITQTPPCCHSPHLCGGPHPDCYDALRAETDDALPASLDSGADALNAADEPCLCGTSFTCLATAHDADRHRPDNVVVHIDQRRRCCAKDGCRPDCR